MKLLAIDPGTVISAALCWDGCKVENAVIAANAAFCLIVKDWQGVVLNMVCSFAVTPLLDEPSNVRVSESGGEKPTT